MKQAAATKSKELKANVFAYIINAIDGENYGVELNTDKEKINFVMDCFTKEALQWQKERNPNISGVTVFTEWLQGLPSSINIDYENYRILELAERWGSIKEDANESTQQKIINNWFNFVSINFFQLHKKLNK